MYRPSQPPPALLPTQTTPKSKSNCKSRRLPNVRVLYHNQYELLVRRDHDLPVPTPHPQHAQLVRRVQIAHEVGRPRRQLRQHRRVLRRLLLRQRRLQCCPCGGWWYQCWRERGEGSVSCLRMIRIIESWHRDNTRPHDTSTRHTRRYSFLASSPSRFIMMTPSTPLWLRIRARVSSTSDALLVAAAAAMVARLWVGF